MNNTTSIKVLLADDDKDDCLFFEDALTELKLPVILKTVHDGEQVLKHLHAVSPKLPDILFLDLNMPRKNGFECLMEIKKHSTLNKVPVIIYSTTYNEEKANQLYDSGAHYFICKPPDFEELKKVIQSALLLVQENCKPTLENFFINKPKTVF